MLSSIIKHTHIYAPLPLLNAFVWLALRKLALEYQGTWSWEWDQHQEEGWWQGTEGDGWNSTQMWCVGWVAVVGWRERELVELWAQIQWNRCRHAGLKPEEWKLGTAARFLPSDFIWLWRLVAIKYESFGFPTSSTWQLSLGLYVWYTLFLNFVFVFWYPLKSYRSVINKRTG